MKGLFVRRGVSQLALAAQDFVNWPAQQCCKSFPASICDKDVKAMTPCLRSQDRDLGFQSRVPV